MLRVLYRFLMGFTVVASLLMASNAHAVVPRFNDIEPAARTSADWRGGPVSLPIGRGHASSEILAASFGLPQTQELIAAFTERGYIRRQDQDQAGSTDSISFAFLVWEKPGLSTLTEAPVIRILSKTYFEPEAGRKIIATQAFAGVLRDSSGLLTTYMTGNDAPIVIGELVAPGTPGAIAIDRGKLPQESGDAWAYRMAYRDGPGGIGTMYKDAVKASCPWRKTVSQYGMVGGFAVLGTVSAISGNWVGAAALAIASKAADQWIETKWQCN